MATLGELGDRLLRHVRLEERGAFPIAVVTLGARGWATIDVAHEAEAGLRA